MFLLMLFKYVLPCIYIYLFFIVFGITELCFHGRFEYCVNGFVRTSRALR